jgi:hypothetical protein
MIQMRKKEKPYLLATILRKDAAAGPGPGLRSEHPAVSARTLTPTALELRGWPIDCACLRWFRYARPGCYHAPGMRIERG